MLMKKLRLYKKPSPLYVYRSEIFWTVLTLAYLLFIYSNSMKNGTESAGQSRWALSLVERMAAMLGLETGLTEHLLRKAAHFGEYLVLGLLLVKTMGAYHFYAAYQFRIALALGFVMACGDECLQLFVEGRSGQFSDVLLDTCGILAGILLYLLLLNCLRLRTGRPI